MNGLSIIVPDEHLAVIEHPCIIKNIPKAIKSLGGERLLDQSLTNASPDNPIELSLRPEDPWAKRNEASIVKSQNVLLKISVPKRAGRKRKRGSDDPFEVHHDGHVNGSQLVGNDSKADTLLQSMQDNPSSYTITPVGIIRQTYRFRSLVDFQYSTSTSPLMQNLSQTVLTSDYNRFKSFAIDPTRGIAPGLDVGPPPVMNLMKVPFNYSYRQNFYTRLTTDLVTGERKLITLNPTRRYTNHVLPFSVPEIPSEPPVPLEPIGKLDKKLQECIVKFKAELEKRPIMAKRAQENLIEGMGDYNLRRCWPYVGYMFSSGPFRDAIIRFGVDPRTDSSCAKYQTLWFQAPGAAGYGRTGLEEEWSATTRRYLRPVNYGKEVRDSHVFDGQTLYRDGKTWQICDVTDPMLRRIIDEAPLRESCDDTTGWYGNGTWAMLKFFMKEKIAALAEGKERDESLFEAIVPTIPAFLNPGNLPAVPRGAGREVLRVSGLIRNTALLWGRKGKKKGRGRGPDGRFRREMDGEGSLVEEGEDGDEGERDSEDEEGEGDMDVDEENPEEGEDEGMQEE